MCRLPRRRPAIQGLLFVTQSGRSLLNYTSTSEGIWILEKWQQWARIITRDAHALYLAAGDPRVPWYAKALAIGVAAYALSPIDLIPDVVPVLGMWTISSSFLQVSP